MKLFIKKTNELLKNPLKRAYEKDVGIDLFAASEPKIVGKPYLEHDGRIISYKSIDYIEYLTNIYLTPEEGYHVELLSRSSISNFNLILKNSLGLVDPKFTGNLTLRFQYIFQPEDLDFYSREISGRVNWDKIYKRGDKLAQLIIRKTVYPEIEYIEELSKTERGSGGFGSSNN